MKRLLYKILPACLLAIGLQGCDDETRYNPLPEAVPLTMTVNGQAFAMGEHLRVDIEVNKDAEGNEVTPNEDFDVYFTAKSGSEDVSDLFDPFSNIVTFPKGEKKIQVDFPVKKEGLKGHKNLNFVAFARGYKMAHSSAVIKVSDYYRITMSLENNMDNTVLDGGKCVLVAQIDKPRSIPIRITIEPKEGEELYFEGLPSSLIIPAGASSVKSDEITLSLNGAAIKSKELTLSFESSSKDNPMTEETMAITLKGIDDPNLYDPTKVYANPELMFVSSTNKNAVTTWGKIGSCVDMKADDVHPTAELTTWKFINAIEFHKIGNSYWGGAINEAKTPWSLADTNDGASQLYQSVDNVKFSKITDEGILKMWAEAGDFAKTGGITGRNPYGAAGFYSCNFDKNAGTAPQFVRIYPGIRIEFKVRLRGTRDGFIPWITLKDPKEAYRNMNKKEIDIVRNEKGNIITQCVYTTQLESSKKVSLPTAGDWNIYWAELEDSEIRIGINGSTTVTLKKEDASSWPFDKTTFSQKDNIPMGLDIVMRLSPSAERDAGTPIEGWDTVLKSITDYQNDDRTPRMEIDWVRFYKKEGVYKWDKNTEPVSGKVFY